MSQIRKEIQEVTGKKQKAGETDAQFAVRVATFINSKVSDEDWRRLSETPTQYWVNDVLELADLNEQSKGGEEGLLAAFGKPRSRNKATVPSILEELGGAGNEVETEREKPAKRAKEKPAKREGVTDGKRGRPVRYPMDAKITVISEENPCRKGSGRYENFAKLKTGMTVREAFEAIGPHAWRLLQTQFEVYKNIKIG